MLLLIKVVLLDAVVKIVSADGCHNGSITVPVKDAALAFLSLIVECVAVFMDASLVVLLIKCCWFDATVVIIPLAVAGVVATAYASEVTEPVNIIK